MRLLRRIPLHVSLLLLVAWSALPFVWTFQTSIKFTRDVASREPVLWGYDTTANGYEAFWFEGEVNMWSVLWFLVGLAGLCVLTYQLGKRLRLGVIGNAVVALLLTIAVWSVPKIWETSDQYRFFVNSLIVTVLTVITSIGIGVFGGMIAATLLAVFFVPLFYLTIERISSRGKSNTASTPPTEPVLEKVA